MLEDQANQFGDFALFGFSQDLTGSLLEKFRYLGIAPRTINYGRAGTFYFFTTYGDVAETDELLGLKLGFIRTPGMNSLSTGALLTQKLIDSSSVQSDRLRGNAVIACFNKTTPEFSIYQTVFATPQLYYTAYNGSILCSSSQRCLVNLLDRLELNEAAIPFHFMFQLVPGPLTYYRDVYRLFPGQHLRWTEGRLEVNTVKDLRFLDNVEYYDRVDAESTDRIFERIKQVLDVYLNDMAKEGHAATNLLSGGVDSAVLQLVLNDRNALAAKLPSYSYAVHVPGFEFEVRYALEASRLLGTEHVIADIYPEELPGIIGRAIEAVAQPIPGEADACKIAMAEFLAARPETSRYFLSGQVADALYGMGLARKVALFNLFRKIPASEQVLKSIAAVVKPGSTRVAGGLREVAKTLAAIDNPGAYEHWPNVICTYVNLPIARRAFGDAALQRALAYRRDLEKQYLGSRDLCEQLHTIDMLTEGYEPAVFSSQMFLTHKKEQIYPFLDEDIIRIAFAFDSKIRFIKPGLGFVNQNQTKYLLKKILVQKSYAAIALKTKGASAFDTDLFAMMKTGALREMTHAIERPGFLSKSDFEALLEQPDHFLWNLLTLDTFQKRVLKQTQVVLGR